MEEILENSAVDLERITRSQENREAGATTRAGSPNAGPRLRERKTRPFAAKSNNAAQTSPSRSRPYPGLAVGPGGRHPEAASDGKSATAREHVGSRTPLESDENRWRFDGQAASTALRR